MNGRITLTRPYTPMIEGQQYRPSLVGYVKRDYEMEKVPVQSKVEITEKPGNELPPLEYYTRVSKYQHHLYLNLWLFEIDLEWITEAK